MKIKLMNLFAALLMKGFGAVSKDTKRIEAWLKEINIIK